MFYPLITKIWRHEEVKTNLSFSQFLDFIQFRQYADTVEQGRFLIDQKLKSYVKEKQF